MAENYIVLISGLPASGKTTMAHLVSEVTGFPLFDKDLYLEQLYEERGVGDFAWRRALSRESDLMFQEGVRSAGGSVVVVSHWRPTADQEGLSGTPTDWLGELDKRIVELYCTCAVETAVKRFIGRERHPGHRDRDRTEAEIYKWMSQYQQALPLRVGQLVSISTDQARPDSDTIKQLLEAYL